MLPGQHKLQKMSYTIRLVSPVGNGDAYRNIQWGNTNSTDDVIQIIKFACESTLELRRIFQETLFHTIIDLNDLTIIKAYAEAYNRIVNDILTRQRKIRNLSKHQRISSRDLVHFILKLSSEKENQLSIENEYSFDLIDELITKCSIRSDNIFIHLGCTYGHVPLQIAAIISCQKSIGVETNPALYRSAKIFQQEFSFWMKWFGKSCSDCQIIEGDFFHENFRSILKSGNVIFVNNQSFSNDKNHNLKLRFYDLQGGSRIISTRPFCKPNNRVTARNINDIDSFMSLISIENLKANSQLTFYLQTIDYSRIEQYFDGIHRKGNFDLNGNEGNVNEALLDVDTGESVSTNINSSEKRLKKTKQIENKDQNSSLIINKKKKK